MSLGSPAGSHGTGFSTHQTPHGCQYLPGFLMGDLSLNTVRNFFLNKLGAMLSPRVSYPRVQIGVAKQCHIWLQLVT